MKSQYMCTVDRSEVRPFYWNTNLDEIELYTFADQSLQNLILKQDPDALSIRFGVLPNGSVIWWNGSVNHTGICDWLTDNWILTGIWKFGDDKFTSNNKYSLKQLEKEMETEEFQVALEHLRKFGINEIQFSTCTFKY